MASEFYEQLGVDRTASAARIRSAYGQAVSRLARRRRALVEQGGETSQIDLQRARLDEAWAVLADPLRRRRYDVMLSWTEGQRPKTAEGVWDEVSDALVHPAAAVAAKLLRVTSRLTEIGLLPLAPSGAADEPPTLVPHDDDLTAPRPAKLGAGARPVELGPHMAEPPPVPRLAAPPETPELRVVDGSPGASDVLVLPPRPPTPPPRPTTRPEPPPRPQVQALPTEEVLHLVDEHGYGGTLLKIVRERLGLTLQDVADHTRISVRYLEALEVEARDALPSATFVRGYVREVARMLQLDSDPVVAGYMRRYEG
jgi:hypothetical protein